MILQASDHAVPPLPLDPGTVTTHGLLTILRQPGRVEVQSSPNINLNLARVMARGLKSFMMYDFSEGGLGQQLRWFDVPSLKEPLEVTVLYKIASYASGPQWVRVVRSVLEDDDDENEDN